MLLTVVTGLLSSTVLGLVKRATGAADTAVGKVLKPVQPFVVAGLSVLLPVLANAAHIVNMPTPEAVANAPAAALVGIVAREIATRLAPKPPAS